MRITEADSPATDLSRDDNFKLMRLLTALVVAATHSLWVVYGLHPSNDWPLNLLMQASHCGICIFFGFSGYLITKSLSNRPDLFRYGVARFLRICPLLFVASVIMAFVVGPLVSELSFHDYYGDWRLWAYVPFSTFAYPDMTLPGVFVNAPSESEVNISLWTLRYELIAYAGMALIAALGLLGQRFVWVWAGAAIFAYAVITYLTPLRSEVAFLDHGLRFGFAFLMGILLFSYRHIIPLNFFGVVFVVGLAWLTNSSGYMEPFRIIALTYTAIWIATKPALMQPFNRLGDFSYGVFVFHWPIAQVVLQYNPAISYPELLLNVLPLALMMAILSWYGIERPLLSSKTLIAWRLLGVWSGLRQFGRRAIEVMTVYPEDDLTQSPVIHEPHRLQRETLPHDSSHIEGVFKATAYHPPHSEMMPDRTLPAGGHVPAPLSQFGRQSDTKIAREVSLPRGPVSSSISASQISPGRGVPPRRLR
ncbi:MAG: hypothetical protein DHS20C08_13370 [Rhodomicrobium sp.]|nr:MAG: hypothetical protein DHS20C08_13370 [Rhodomicrobium sp.]